MKKHVIRLIVPFITIILLSVSSCKKDETIVAGNTTPEGTWSGTAQYGTTPGNPTYIFTINFKSTGIADITGDNGTGPDIATGTWQMVSDSVKVAYRYAGSSADYTLSGRFTPGSTSINGTIGLGSATTGTGIFSITKQ